MGHDGILSGTRVPGRILLRLYILLGYLVGTDHPSICPTCFVRFLQIFSIFTGLIGPWWPLR